jgi:CRISP-associated protein Cas1
VKTHLNTLFVTTEGSYVAKEGEALVVRRDGDAPFRVPVHMISSLVCFGQVGVSPAAMALCAGRGVAITHLTARGRFLAQVNGYTTGNILLRKAQFRATEDPARCLDLARTFVSAKLHNSRVVLLRAVRDHGDEGEQLSGIAARLARSIEKARTAADLDTLRGIEGEGARHYFGGLVQLVRSPDPSFKPQQRTRRPPRDSLNALLSFAYSLLAADCRSACEAVGLDPQAGFLHADRPGRAGLALDLMEELRPVIADRVALSLLNRQQLKPDDFVVEMGGGVRIMDAPRKVVLEQYHARKAEEVTHPFLGEKMTLGVLCLIQARLLAKAIRGELDAYPAYLWR